MNAQRERERFKEISQASGGDYTAEGGDVKKKVDYIISYVKNRSRGILWSESAEAYSKALDFLRMVTPQSVVNVPKVRIGGKRDGGYVMLDPGRGGVAYSFGVSVYAPWDIEMASKRNFTVYQYDGSVDKSPDAHPNIYFHKFYIDSNPMPPNDRKNLNQIFDDLKHHEENDIILQIDIEGAEWDFFETITPEHISKFKQIIVEFHGCHPDAEIFDRYLRVISKINQTHQSIHLHCNSVGSVTCFPNMFLFARTFEISYARKISPERDGFHFSPCAAWYPTELDASNNSKLPDIPIGFLVST
jgi:hypothetical protein